MEFLHISVVSTFLQKSFVIGAALEIFWGYQGRNEGEENRKNEDKLFLWSWSPASAWVAAPQGSNLPELPSPTNTQTAKRQPILGPASASKALTRKSKLGLKPSAVTGCQGVAPWVQGGHGEH